MAASSSKVGLYIGLGISGLLLFIVAIVLIVVLNVGTSIGEPTSATTDFGKLDKMELPLDTSGLFATPTGSGGADGLYKEAFRAAVSMGGSVGFEEMVKHTAEPEKDGKLKPIIEKLLSAADTGMSSDAELNFDSVLVCTPKTTWPIRDRIADMALCLNTAGLSYRADKSPDMAVRCFRASTIFGKRLWDNGVFVSHKAGALSAIGYGLSNLERNYKEFQRDPAKAELAHTLYLQYLEVSQKWSTKERIERTVQPVTGDLWNLAENDKDRAWRIEGVMFMGFAKFTVSDSRAPTIRSYLQGKTSSSDPLIALKAKEALLFSESDARSLPQ